MSQYNDSGYRSFTATAAIAQYALVKAASVSTCTTAGLNEVAIGVAMNAAFAAGDRVNVGLLTKQGTLPMLASGAFSVNAVLYGRASGKVDDIASGAIRCGIALEAATAANDVVEVVPYGP